MKDEITYRERYKKPMKHMKAPIFHSKKMECFEAYTLEAGVVERDGERIEYQVVKAFFREKEIDDSQG
jgi:hypothetical protein